jgi:hypothetical protein
MYFDTARTRYVMRPVSGSDLPTPSIDLLITPGSKLCTAHDDSNFQTQAAGDASERHSGQTAGSRASSAFGRVH